MPIRYAAFLLVLIFYLFVSPLVGSRDTHLLVCFLDIGQGDSIYIADMWTDTRMVIDGGPYATVVHKLDKLVPFWDRTIDVVVASHPDDDHISGLVGVLRRFKVGLLMVNEDEKSTPAVVALEKYSREYSVETVVALEGTRLAYESGLQLDWLWPREKGRYWNLSSNDQSQVILLRYGDFSVLLTGDLSERRLSLVLNEHQIEEIDVLKASHHGARDGTSRRVMDELMAEYAVLSLGTDNRYGHPHPEVMEVLDEYGVKVLRTDEQGDICFRVRGSGVSIDLSLGGEEDKWYNRLVL